MTIEEAIKRFQSNAEYERTHGNLQGCLEFRQLVEWLRKYQKIESKIKVLQHFTEDTPLATQRMIRIVNEISEVLEDGNE